MTAVGRENAVASDVDSAPRPAAIELSVVMPPCLNEADTLAICIQKAQHALLDCHASGEIIVADNASTDGSQSIARLGARFHGATVSTQTNTSVAPAHYPSLAPAGELVLCLDAGDRLAPESQSSSAVELQHVLGAAAVVDRREAIESVGWLSQARERVRT